MTQQVFESLDDLSPLIVEHRWHRCVVVADKAALEQSGAQAKLECLLSNRPLRYFNRFECNPKSEHVVEGAKLLR